MGYIYKITNIQNNKIYIGKTKYSIYNRFESHIRAAFKSNRKYYFYNAIRKYGKDNFKIDLIEECDNSILSEREKYWISFYNSIDKSIGYNSTLGGEGGDTFTYQSKERQKEISAKKSQSMTGKSRKPLTIEQRKRISEGHLGQVAWNKGLTKETDEFGKVIINDLPIGKYYIIEKEANSDEDRAKVSQVIYSRIAKKMNLGMDVTAYYAAKVEQTKDNPYMKSWNYLPSKYNTRNVNNLGLPIGPICNPSISSIKAALYPAKTNYLYFYADINTGKVYFAEDYAGFIKIQKDLGVL